MLEFVNGEAQEIADAKKILEQLMGGTRDSEKIIATAGLQAIIDELERYIMSKRRVFCRQIRSRCEKEWWAVAERSKVVGLLAAIYESNNDVLIQSLPCLPEVLFTSLGPDEADMFSSILAKRGSEKKEEKVDLRDCGLNDELLDIMVQNLKDRKIRVRNLDLSSNEWLTAKGVKSFLAICKSDIIKIDFELLKYFRYEDFEWNNITKIEWCHFRHNISMTNRGERIEIRGFVNGYFDKTRRAWETET